MLKQTSKPLRKRELAMSKNSKTHHSYQNWIGIISIVISACACLAAIVVIPEVRNILGLENSEGNVIKIPIVVVITATSEKITPSPTTVPNILSATVFGQDGSDYAVSGCIDGVLGLKGVVDNHIQLTNVKNTDTLDKVDIEYGIQHHWNSPCNNAWEIVTHINTRGTVDLYFEPADIESSQVTYRITLTYGNGNVEQIEIIGSSGKVAP